MRRIDLRVAAGDLDRAYDVLLPLLRGGLHRVGEEDDPIVELVALGEPGELPPAAQIAQEAAGLLVDAPVEADAGEDLAAALAALIPAWEIAGRVKLRREHHEPPPDGWIDVVLGRTRGFGTGAHPTTRHCLELLVDVEPRGSFADLGCGAGALTIAAAKLGFTPVVGVDYADEITAPAFANVELNGVDVDIVTGNLLLMDALETTVACVNVADLEVHEHVAGVRLPELETLIVSGLRNPRELEASLRAFAAAGFTEERRVDRDDWPAVLLRRRSAAAS